MRSPKTVIGAGALTLLPLLGACSSTPTTAPSSTTSSATPTTNQTSAAVEAARSAYYGARTTIVEVEKAPKRTMAEYPAPLQAKMRQYLEGKALDGLLKAANAWATTGYLYEEEIGLSTPMVAKADPSAGVVILAHCAADETATMRHNGQKVKVGPGPGQAPGPHLTRYTMRLRDGQWRLSESVEETKKTCAPDTL